MGIKEQCAQRNNGQTVGTVDTEEESGQGGPEGQEVQVQGK